MKNESISEHGECLSEKLRGRTYKEKKLEVEFSALNWCNGKSYSPVTFSTPTYYTICSCFPVLLMQAFMFLLNNFYETVGQKIRSLFYHLANFRPDAQLEKNPTNSQKIQYHTSRLPTD